MMADLFKLKKAEIALVAFLLLVSFFIRFYKINNNLFFGWEQGRDAQIIQNIYTFKHFPLTGPKTDIGGIFHGPYYYYLMAVPYWLGQGNPLVASFFLILLSSFVPIIIYFLIKDVFKSTSWGVLAGLLTAISYEFISISRWLSNVTPAVFFIALSYLFLWLYFKNRNSKIFLASVFFAAFASQFEIYLIAQFIFTLFLLFAFRLLKIPPLKVLLAGLGIVAIIFSPLVLFDFRNQHITSLSILHFFNGGGAEKYTFDIATSARDFGTQILLLLKRTFIDNGPLPEIIFGASAVVGLFLKREEKWAGRDLLFFFIVAIGILPLIFLGASLTQLYLGAGIGLICLLVFSLRNYWNHQRIVFWVLSFLLILNIYTTLLKLSDNKDVFYTTIQEGMNIQSQREVLSYVYTDSGNSPFFFEAFTVPSLHQEGWDYLLSYYYPHVTNQSSAKRIYIAIEKGVYGIWENRWIGDLGKTKLLGERNFGVIRLQTRERSE